MLDQTLSAGRTRGTAQRHRAALAEVKAQAILIEELRHRLARHRAHRFGASSQTDRQLQRALDTSEIPPPRCQGLEGIEDDAGFAARPVDALRLDLVRALQSLLEHYRTVILMRDVEELTIDEIARATGSTREAVQGRLIRARAMMREYLKD